MRKLKHSETLAPAILGFSVGTTFGAITTSFFFNSVGWYLLGKGQSFEQLYTAVSTSSLFTYSATLISLISYLITGYVAAKFSANRPYFNSLIAGLITLAWLIYLQFSSPLQVIKLEPVTIILWLTIGPLAILGARMTLKRGSNG